VYVGSERIGGASELAAWALGAGGSGSMGLAILGRWGLAMLLPGW
jgi:hypothetical protein